MRIQAGVRSRHRRTFSPIRHRASPEAADELVAPACRDVRRQAGIEFGAGRVRRSVRPPFGNLCSRSRVAACGIEELDHHVELAQHTLGQFSVTFDVGRHPIDTVWRLLRAR